MTKQVKCKKVKPKSFDKQVAKRLWFLMYIMLGLSLLAQFFIADGTKHHFSVEGIPFFYAAFGFVSCVIVS
jgi:hypothetical protein